MQDERKARELKELQQQQTHQLQLQAQQQQAAAAAAAELLKKQKKQLAKAAAAGDGTVRGAEEVQGEKELGEAALKAARTSETTSMSQE